MLNQRLVEALPNEIKTRFNTRLSHIDFGERIAFGMERKPKQSAMPGTEHDDGRIGGGAKGEGKHKEQAMEDEEGTFFDLVIGCDGSWSKVRSEMMRVERYESFPHAPYLSDTLPPDLTSRSHSSLMLISSCICLRMLQNLEDLQSTRTTCIFGRGTLSC